MTTSSKLRTSVFGLSIVTSLLFICQAATADDKSEVETLLKNTLDTIVKVLQKQDLEQQAKNKEIVDIVTPLFDFELMAREGQVQLVL